MRTPPHWSSHILCIMISNTLIHIIEDIWYVYCLIYRVSQNKVTNRKLVIKPVHRAFWWNWQPPPFHEVFRQCSRFYPDTLKIMRFFSSTNNFMDATIGATEMALWTIISKDDVWWLATENSGEHLESMKHTRLWCHVHWVGGEEEVGGYEQQVIVTWWHWNINQGITNIQTVYLFSNRAKLRKRQWMNIKWKGGCIDASWTGNREQVSIQCPNHSRENKERLWLQLKPSVQKSDVNWSLKFYHRKYMLRKRKRITARLTNIYVWIVTVWR